eukprot:2287596-Prymnesium_polylepis.1
MGHSPGHTRRADTIQHPYAPLTHTEFIRPPPPVHAPLTPRGHQTPLLPRPAFATIAHTHMPRAHNTRPDTLALAAAAIEEGDDEFDGEMGGEQHSKGGSLVAPKGGGGVEGALASVAAQELQDKAEVRTRAVASRGWAPELSKS